MVESYDVIIVGGGVAGLTAGLFTARYGLRSLLLESLIPGGQVCNAEHIENFPGFPQKLSGAELGALVQEQAVQNGLEVRSAEALRLGLEDPYRLLETTEGALKCKAVIIACGSSRRKLGIPGEEEFFGSGVSTCATCDGPFFVGGTVAVIGGGDAALDEAMTLTHFAERVLIFHRRDRFRAQKALQDRALAEPKVQVRWSTQLTAIEGGSSVESVTAQRLDGGAEEKVAVAGVFVCVGSEPNTGWLRVAVPLDESGRIPVDLWMRTPVPGVFAAGDVREDSAAQLASAAGDGATAAIAAFRYLSERTWDS